ncbi:MAG: hypothetical protein LQ338_004532 [Usnochroma carphineum]|nr:MAG: hypothetical protein LQ338_004532 [Usnochroma carphineum]
MAHYPYYGTSTESSPSPRMVQYGNYDSMNGNTYTMINTQRLHQQTQDILNTVEFTDLTAPVHEDRRRRKSTTPQDRQAISNMRIRRRAQNRASQRAFRERKEKHVQHLEHELETLEAKHRELQKSHSNLGDTNGKLKQEVEQLRAEIKTLKLFGDGSSSTLGSPVSNDFDQFEQDGLFDSAAGDFVF